MHGHGQRARNGRGAHGQQVRHTSVVARCKQASPLRHAEAMLLVHDRQAEAGERHVVLQQGVRADGEVDVAARQGLELAQASRAAATAGEPADTHATALEPCRQRVGMLARQDLGGREHGHLVAGGDRDQRGVGRDGRLPGADVALQQATHRDGLREIGGDLGHDGVLARGEREREAGPDALVELGRRGTGHAAAPGHGTATQAKGHASRRRARAAASSSLGKCSWRSAWRRGPSPSSSR